MRLLIGIIVLICICLGACGSDAGPELSEVAGDPYLTPVEYPACRWQEDADIDYVDSAGYPTPHEALNATVDELFYGKFVVVDQTEDTVIWQINDANSTPAGTVTARKFSSGLWAVERARLCLPSRLAAKLDTE